MDTKWLEDFLALAETGSFSRAAQRRHISQPAFSRRIQALEAWLGQDLIQRVTYPPRLTPAGESFHAQALDLMQRIGQLQEGQPAAGDDSPLRIALPHTLSLNFVPHWLKGLTESLGRFPTLLRPGNMLDVVLWLVEGGCDLLIGFHHPQQPLQLDPERYDMLTLDRETLSPYALCDAQGRPLHSLPGKASLPVPYLAYSSSAYLGRMAALAMMQGRSRPHLAKVCETDMAEGLRQLVLAGHGVAFLPARSVAADVAAGRLQPLPGGWEVDMEIRAWRERPSLARPAPRRLEQVWQLLEATHAQTPTALAGLTIPPRNGVRRADAS